MMLATPFSPSQLSDPGGPANPSSCIDRSAGRGHPGFYSEPSASTTDNYRQTHHEDITSFQANISLLSPADARSSLILPSLEQHKEWTVSETSSLQACPDSYLHPSTQTSNGIKIYGQINMNERLDQIVDAKNIEYDSSTYIEPVQEPLCPVPGYYRQSLAVGVPQNAYEVGNENCFSAWYWDFTQENLYQPCPRDPAQWSIKSTSASSKILSTPIHNEPTKTVLYKDSNRSAWNELQPYDPVALPSTRLISFDKSPSWLYELPLSGSVHSRNLGRKKLTDEQKRRNHKAHEQKRRNEYKKNLESLIGMVPGLKTQGLSKSAALAKVAQWLAQLQTGNELLRVQAVALEVGRKT